MGLVSGFGKLSKYGPVNWMIDKKASDRPLFQDSEYAETLRRQREEGRYSKSARDAVLGSAARSSGAAAQTGRADYLGRLTAQGMGGSIASQRGANEFDIERSRQLGELGSQLTAENELSKVDAEMDYGRLLRQDQLDRFNYREGLSNDFWNSVGGVTDPIEQALMSKVTGGIPNMGGGTDTGYQATIAELKKQSKNMSAEELAELIIQIFG